MSNGTVIEQIGVSVSKNVLGKVSRFFNGTDSDVMHELLQNARRAGATRVDVTLEEGFMTIADDGAGIANPASLLGFGESDWSDASVQDEDPAGIGVFSLARRVATVTSRPRGGQPWTVELTPEHFAGKAEAEVRTVAESAIEHGTRIRFELDASQLRPTAVVGVAEYYPVPVFLNGEPVKQRPFLDGAIWREEWNGVELGVFRSVDLSRERSMNFHGVVLSGTDLPFVRTEDDGWVVRVDVRRAPDLDLVLPARKEVVESPFMAELREVARVAIFRGLAALDPPQRVSAKLRQEALDAGVELPAPEVMLRPWRPTHSDWVVNQNERQQWPAPVSDDALVVDVPNWTASEEQALWRAASAAGVADRLYNWDSAMQGYEWYDGLTRVTGMQAIVTIGGEDAVYTADLGGPGADRPERIVIRLTTQQGEQTGALDLETDLAVPGFPDSEDIRWVDEIDVAIARDSAMTVPELTDFFEAAYFSTSDDWEADSRESQLESFRIAAVERAVRYLESDDAALARVVEEVVRRYVVGHVPFKRPVLVRIDPGWKIRVQVGDRDEERGVPVEDTLIEDTHRAGHIGTFVSGCVHCDIERHADAIRRASSPGVLRSAGLPEPDQAWTVAAEESVTRRAVVRVLAYSADGAGDVVRERASHGDRSIRWELAGDYGYDVSAAAFRSS